MKSKRQINHKSKFYENNKARAREKAMGWVGISNMFAHMQYILGNHLVVGKRKGRRRKK